MVFTELDRNLLNACRELDIERVRELLELGANPNANDFDVPPNHFRTFPLLTSFISGYCGSVYKNENPDLQIGGFGSPRERDDDTFVLILDLLITYGADLPAQSNWIMSNARTNRCTNNILEILGERGALFDILAEETLRELKWCASNGRPCLEIIELARQVILYSSYNTNSDFLEEWMNVFGLNWWLNDPVVGDYFQEYVEEQVEILNNLYHRVRDTDVILYVIIPNRYSLEETQNIIRARFLADV